MLSALEDTGKIKQIEVIATTLSKALSGVEHGDALMALCLVISDVIEQSVDASQWHLTLADVSMAIAINLGEDEDEPASETEH